MRKLFGRSAVHDTTRERHRPLLSGRRPRREAIAAMIHMWTEQRGVPKNRRNYRAVSCKQDVLIFCIGYDGGFPPLEPAPEARHNFLLSSPGLQQRGQPVRSRKTKSAAQDSLATLKSGKGQGPFFWGTPRDLDAFELTHPNARDATHRDARKHALMQASRIRSYTFTSTRT